jgi:ATP dependent DNA ligase domain
VTGVPPLPFIIPAQPALRDRPPKGGGWIHEVKHDGYRVQLHKSGRSAVIYSKNGREFSNRFPGILHALLGLPCKSAIIDAEVVALKEDGSTDFRALHSGNYTQDNLCAWCFDLFALNDTDMRPLPLALASSGSACSSSATITGACATRRASGMPKSFSPSAGDWAWRRRTRPTGQAKCDWLKIKCAQWREDNKDRGDLFGQHRTRHSRQTTTAQAAW